MNISDIKHIHLMDEQPLKVLSGRKKHSIYSRKKEKEPVT